jgi:hypothetical protein
VCSFCVRQGGVASGATATTRKKYECGYCGQQTSPVAHTVNKCNVRLSMEVYHAAEDTTEYAEWLRKDVNSGFVEMAQVVPVGKIPIPHPCVGKWVAAHRVSHRRVYEDLVESGSLSK